VWQCVLVYMCVSVCVNVCECVCECRCQSISFLHSENRTKFNLTWNEDETELSYTLETTYTFDKNRSQGNDPNTTIITTVNVPLIVSSYPSISVGSNPVDTS